MLKPEPLSRGNLVECLVRYAKIEKNDNCTLLPTTLTFENKFEQKVLIIKEHKKSHPSSYKMLILIPFK